MATDRALITELCALAAAIETTTGTVPSMTGADIILNAMDVTPIEADIPPTERKAQSTLSPLQPVPGARMGKVTFKTEVIGSGVSGTDPKWLSRLLAACSFAKVATAWKPKSGSDVTAAFGGYHDGRLFNIAGAMGKVTIDAEAGAPAMCSWEFNGVWVAPTSVALITPTNLSIVPPTFAGATMTIGGTAYLIPKVQISIENVLQMRKDGTPAAGYHACGIFGRKIGIKVNPEALPLSTKDWFAAHLAGTSVAFSLQIGSAAFNTITIAAPKMVLLNPPKSENDGGIYRDALEFLPFSTTAGGDDEISIIAS